ncbi:MAG: cytidylyltransferase [Parcubacteria group bacterium]|nr:cytidylyltransferase [Parcubacteria group bacterium]
MIVALLIGREGSVGFPGKNILPILGRELMAYPLLAAKNSKYVERVYVSTDSDKIKEIGRKHGAEIIDRPDELCNNKALGENAFVHGYKVIRDKLKEEGKEVELIALLHCNAPTILASQIDEGVKVLRENPEYDSVVTVGKYNMYHPNRMRKINKDGLLEPFVPLETFGDPKTMTCDRDSSGDAWLADVALSLVRPRCLENIEDGLLPQKWMGNKIYPIENEAGLDIDYEWQWGQMEWWLKKNGFTEEKTPYDSQ